VALKLVFIAINMRKVATKMWEMRIWAALVREIKLLMGAVLRLVREQAAFSFVATVADYRYRVSQP
jgi:hypothetical protein